MYFNYLRRAAELSRKKGTMAERGRNAALLPPLPLTFEEAVSGLLKVGPVERSAPAKSKRAARRKRQSKAKSRKKR